MRKLARAIILVVLALLSSVALGVMAMLTPSALSLAAVQTATALIMGGSGTPDPDKELGYVPNVSNYYIFPNSACKPDNCTLKSVVTPEEAWPLYGGLTARTWKQSILDGVTIYDAAVRNQLQTSDTNVVMFGYSQSGAILAIEKRALADDPTIASLIGKLQIVVIGNVSRPNGGLNARLPITIPIVEFPFGPSMPTDTTIKTTDIALKWDIIADAPLVVTNPLAMLNALIGGPGFGINHGTYPNPEGDPPTGLVGGYTQAEWQAIMDNPEGYAATNPDVVNVQYFGDTKYITVAPRVLPLLVPLHTIGLGFVADLVEPALRDIIEQTGYDRSIPYGQPTQFQMFPVFDPVKLAVDLIQDIPEGIQQAMNGGAPPLNPPETATTSTTSTSLMDSQATDDLSVDVSADPQSGSTTWNGTKTTLKKTEVDNDNNISGANMTQSSKTEAKKDETSQPDETTTSATTAANKKADANKAVVKKSDDKKADDTAKQVTTKKTADNGKKSNTDTEDADSAKAAA